jgi:hypothetical protein
MARGVPKNFRNRVGSLAAGNSPTNAVTTTDISLTVRAYDHAGLGSPPPKHLGVQSGVGMPSPALLLPPGITACCATDVLGLLWRIVPCRGAALKPHEIRTVAVLRVYRERGARLTPLRIHETSPTLLGRAPCPWLNPSRSKAVVPVQRSGYVLLTA